MARKAKKQDNPTPEPAQNGNGVMALVKELWQAAVNLRGSIEPADYKRYVLPIIFLRFLSLRYEKRRAELEKLIADPKSDYYTDKPKAAAQILNDPDEYRSAGAFIIPEKARWDYIVKHAQDDDIKVQLDDTLELLEKTYPDKLRGLLPRIYAGSNLDAENVRGLIGQFSKDVFKQDHGGEDLVGRVYEYFIGEFASSEGKRGGEYFTPASIVRMLVAMLEPTRGIVFDPCCGSGGMFVQSDIFTKHNKQLSFVGQESKDFTYRLCRMNLFIHGIDGNIQLGNSYWDDKHPTVKADYILANPPFNDGSKGENGWGADRVPDKDPRLTLGNNKMPLSPRNANTMWMHALPLPPEGRRYRRFCHGDRRAEQQRNGPPGSAQDPGRGRSRRLCRAADRPAFCQHADSLCLVVSVEEPQRRQQLPQAQGRNPLHRRPQARFVDSWLAEAEAIVGRRTCQGRSGLPGVPPQGCTGGSTGILQGRQARRGPRVQVRADAGPLRWCSR